MRTRLQKQKAKLKKKIEYNGPQIVSKKQMVQKNIKL